MADYFSVEYWTEPSSIVWVAGIYLSAYVWYLTLFQPQPY